TMGDNITVFKIQTFNSQPQNPIHTISSFFFSLFLFSFLSLFSLFFFLSFSLLLSLFLCRERIEFFFLLQRVLEIL
ncbi:hypothetical protein ACMBCN_03210, partial [Candidatus Liberibacter asiaticus]|nr:hypothetical protein [Candidatus Liberibacter asiaticus]